MFFHQLQQFHSGFITFVPEIVTPWGGWWLPFSPSPLSHTSPSPSPSAVPRPRPLPYRRLPFKSFYLWGFGDVSWLVRKTSVWLTQLQQHFINTSATLQQGLRNTISETSKLHRDLSDFRRLSRIYARFLTRFWSDFETLNISTKEKFTTISNYSCSPSKIFIQYGGSSFFFFGVLFWKIYLFIYFMDWRDP